MSMLKTLAGNLPLAPELYWLLRSRGRPVGNYTLHKLEKLLPEWQEQVQRARFSWPVASKKVFLFATSRYWLEHVALLGLSLAGQGHTVSLAYLPYHKWHQPINRFDLRRRNIYAQNVLQKAGSLLEIVPLLTVKKAANLPPVLAEAIALTALRDTQYTLQMEEVDPKSDLYRLRLARNSEAARAVLDWMGAHKPDVVIIPNGTILEFGAVYQTARFLGLPVVTYEFGEQRGRLWLAQNAEVMCQNTDALWSARRHLPLTDEELRQVQDLFAARQRASLYQNFARRWQGTPSAGGAAARASLGLDDRPLALLATNVIGDSLTLGRQVFSDSMTEWLRRTLQWFADHTATQLVIRIHPGELITKGPSVADVVRQTLADIPPHIHLVPAGAKLNTYDLIEIADLGLVYTTTAGMEMAMSGVPVIVVGNTHYRGKGFTLDVDSWEAYFAALQQVLTAPQDYRLSRQQVDLAWAYAYRFFFEYPHPFPWHLLHIWKDLQEWPLARVLSEEGWAKFGKTFGYLVAEPLQW